MREQNSSRILGDAAHRAFQIRTVAVIVDACQIQLIAMLVKQPMAIPQNLNMVAAQRLLDGIGAYPKVMIPKDRDDTRSRPKRPKHFCHRFNR